MIYVVIVLVLLIITCFAISAYIFHMSLNRYTSKAQVLDNELNAKRTSSHEVIPQDVEWFNKFKKDVHIKSNDNLKLCGYILKNKSDKWDILIHGFSSNHIFMINRAKKLYELGHNILLVDLRGHGKSEGKHITMGIKDCHDIKDWINYLIDKESAKEIGLFGISMGAATVMMTIGLDLPSEVKYAIEDCGYSSVWEEFKYQLNNVYHLPTFPFLYISNLYSMIFAKYNLKSYSCIDAVSKTKIPLLLIHGTSDTFVPYYMFEKLYKACHSKKEKFVVKYANHTEAQDLDYKNYWKTIELFIKSNK